MKQSPRGGRGHSLSTLHPSKGALGFSEKDIGLGLQNPHCQAGSATQCVTLSQQDMTFSGFSHPICKPVVVFAWWVSGLHVFKLIDTFQAILELLKN